MKEEYINQKNKHVWIKFPLGFIVIILLVIIISVILNIILTIPIINIIFIVTVILFIIIGIPILYVKGVIEKIYSFEQPYSTIEIILPLKLVKAYFSNLILLISDDRLEEMKKQEYII